MRDRSSSPSTKRSNRRYLLDQNLTEVADRVRNAAEYRKEEEYWGQHWDADPAATLAAIDMAKLQQYEAHMEQLKAMEDQKEQAEQYLEDLAVSTKKEVHTKLEPMSGTEFYKAEEYHQHYIEKASGKRGR